MSSTTAEGTATRLTLIDLLTLVEAVGGRFILGADGGLVYRGPRDAITDDLRSAIAAHRPALLALATAADLSRPAPPPPIEAEGDDWRECEAAISAIRGWDEAARFVAGTVIDEGRRSALSGYLRERAG